MKMFQFGKVPPPQPTCKRLVPRWEPTGGLVVTGKCSKEDSRTTAPSSFSHSILSYGVNIFDPACDSLHELLPEAQKQHSCSIMDQGLQNYEPK